MAETGERQNTTRLRVGLAFFALLLIGANDGATGVLLPSVIAHYGVDKGAAGALFLGGSLGYLIAAFNSGLLLEKLGRRYLLMLGAGTFTTSAVLYFLLPPFVALFGVVLLSGFGVAIMDAGLNAYIAGLPRSTSLLNYLHAFYGAGALIGPLVASTILALAWAWNTTYLLWLALGGMALIGFALLFDSSGSAATQSGGKTEGNVMRAALRLRAVWFAAAFLLFYVGAEVSTGTWSYSLLTEDRHITPLLAGWMVSGYWAGLTLGRVVLGHIAERSGGARLIQACLVGVAIGMCIVWVAPNGLFAALGLGIVGFALGPIFPTTIAIIGQFVPSRLQQSAIGFVASLGSMGAAFFPWVAGNLAQGFGLWTLLPYVALLSIAMFGCWLLLQNSKTT